MSQVDPDPDEQPAGGQGEPGGSRPRSYRSRLLTGVLVVTVPLVVLLVATLTTVGSRTVESAISHTLEERATAGAAAIGRWIDERQADVAELAAAVEPSLDDPAAVGRLLSDVQAVERDFRVLQVVDADGELIAIARGEDPIDPVGEPWFARAVAGDRVLSSPYLAGGHVRLVAAEPVVDDDDRVVAVVVGDLRVERVGALVGSADFQESAEIIVATAGARLLYTTDSGDPESDAQLLADGSLTIPVNRAVIEDAVTAGRGHARFVDYKGQDVFGGYAAVPGRALVVVARAPESEVLAAERELLLLGVLLGLAALAALATFAGRFASRESAFLRQLTAATEDAAVAVRGQAAAVAGSAVELASTTTQQSAAVTETSTTMEELSRSAASIAATAQDVADQAGQTRDNLSRAEAEIEESSRQTLELAAGVRRITELLGLIDELADQTNMLALNAAIEAARAGEAGEGFAVVADEVRRLAERSKASAGDIAGIIATTEAQMTATLLTMEKGSKQMREGLDQLEDVAVSAEQVRLTTHQQQSATDQVVESMAQASEAAGQVAATAEHIAGVAADLAGTASSLEASASDARQRF
jgi:methyl-accepting chemotaxis protein